MSKQSISYSAVDVQQNVKCLCSQLRVMRAVDYSAFEEVKPTLSLSVDLSKHKNLQASDDSS